MNVTEAEFSFQKQICILESTDIQNTPRGA